MDITTTLDTPPALLADRFKTLRYDESERAVVVLNRRKYPFTTEFVTLRTVEEVALAIEDMTVQGGPPLAYVAALGLAMAARDLDASPTRQAVYLEGVAKRLLATRPTADDLNHIIPATLKVAHDALREQRLAFFDDPAPLWRLSVPIARGALNLPGRQLIDWGGAQRWLKSSASAQSIRAAVAQVGGHVTGYAPGEDSSARLPAALLRYHRALKQQLDPQGIFNPGRLYPDL